MEGIYLMQIELLVFCSLVLLLVLLVLLFRDFYIRRYFMKLLILLRNKPVAIDFLSIKPPQFLVPVCRCLNEYVLSYPMQSGIDKLTGLYNRLGFKETLEKIMPLKTGTLVVVDIYQFKYINDLFGFDYGDKLIKCCGARLLIFSVPPLHVARVNGDEFLMYFDQSLTASHLSELQRFLQMPFSMNASPVSIRVQIGVLNIAKYHAPLGVMLRRLDLALSKARDNKNMIGSYKKGDDDKRLRELTLINSLPNALKQDDFYLLFQPKQNVKDNNVKQVEALMRWQHPELGLISPVEFIPLAECAGMIELLSQWTLTKVLQQQVKWREQGVIIQVAVNLSTRDLNNCNLCEEIQAQLAQYQLPADALMIEITESTLMGDINKAVLILNQLRELGVKLAIDDFGTGHSSLAYLKNLPVDEVKIDKAFISDLLTDLQAAHIMEVSIGLAKKLALDVTVEGVENQEVNDLLIFMGADKIQGDFFSMPMNATELEAFWSTQHKAKVDQTKIEE